MSSFQGPPRLHLPAPNAPSPWLYWLPVNTSCRSTGEGEGAPAGVDFAWWVYSVKLCSELLSEDLDNLKCQQATRSDCVCVRAFKAFPPFYLLCRSLFVARRLEHLRIKASELATVLPTGCRLWWLSSLLISQSADNGYGWGCRTGASCHQKRQSGQHDGPEANLHSWGIFL